MSAQDQDRRAPEGFAESLQMTKEERQEKFRQRAKERQEERRDKMRKAEELGAKSARSDRDGEPEDPLTAAAHQQLSDTITVFDEEGPGVDLEVLPVDPDRGLEMGSKAVAMQNAIAKLDEKSEAELTDEDMERVRELKAEVASVFAEVTRDDRYDEAYVYDTRSGLHIAIEVLNAIQERAAERQREEAEEAERFRG